MTVPACVWTVQTAQIDLGEFAQRAALLSAMVNMPEGSIELLRQRFAEQLNETYYQTAPPPVESYVEPWIQDDGEQPNTPSSPEKAEMTAPTPANGARGPIVAPSPAKERGATVPQKYRGTIVQENMAGNSKSLIPYGDGLLHNYTNVPDETVKSILEKGMNLQLEDTTAPQVLIFHTHATESFEPYDSENYDNRNSWRTTDNNKNMVAVGNALEQALKDAGIGVVHDTTQHDYPSYNGSYERSAETIKKYLEKYPTIQIALDVHRDAIQREDDVIVKPVVEIGGRKAAQLMIITGSDDGTMNVPKWQENLRFAGQVQNAVEQDWPHLTRPIFFCYRKYNMDLTTGSLLLEVGSQANTLEESIYTGQLVGRSLARLLKDRTAVPTAAEGAEKPAAETGAAPAPPEEPEDP